MNKLSAFVLGLSMILGTSAFAAQNAPKTSDKTATSSSKTKKHSKKHSSKAAAKKTSAPAAGAGETLAK